MKRFKSILALALSVLLYVSIFSGCAQKDDRCYVDISDDYRVFYELLVGTYCDSNGDGSGDIQGLIQKLDYLNDGDPSSDSSLHVNGLWLLPVMPSPTYHKYDTTDYYDVDSDYGTLDDFKQLSDECKSRNIALIIDLSVNHSSNLHPWFSSACKSLAIEPCGEEVCPHEELCREHNKYCQYYNFSNTPVSGWHPVREASGWYFEGQYHSGMPDLNLNNELVREEIINICSFWLDMGIYGFRLDSLMYYFNSNLQQSEAFLAWLQSTLNEKYGSVYLVGELWDENERHIKEYYSESNIKSLFVFAGSVTQSGSIAMDVRMGRGSRISDTLLKWEAVADEGEGSVNSYFLSNHDMTRSAGQLNRDIVLKKQAAAVYLLFPGDPYIYYGEEIGMTGGNDNDPNKRMPMVWSVNDTTGITANPEGASSKEWPDAGVAEQLEDKDSLLNFYIEAMKIKNAYPALARGEISANETGEKAICSYAINYEGETYYVYHNCCETQIELGLLDIENPELLETLAAGGEEPTLKGNTLTVPAYCSAIILAAAQYKS